MHPSFRDPCRGFSATVLSSISNAQSLLIIYWRDLFCQPLPKISVLLSSFSWAPPGWGGQSHCSKLSWSGLGRQDVRDLCATWTPGENEVHLPPQPLGSAEWLGSLGSYFLSACRWVLICFSSYRSFHWLSHWTSVTVCDLGFFGVLITELSRTEQVMGIH